MKKRFLPRKTKNEKINAVLEKLNKITVLKEKLEYDLEKLIVKEIGRVKEGITIMPAFSNYMNSCKKSPLGRCIYDKLNDPEYLQCMYCDKKDKLR